MSCHAELVGLAVTRLRDFVVHEDPNLKYLGMQALAALQSVDKALVTSCHDDILAALDDADPAVRSQALSLVSRMTTRANLAEFRDKGGLHAKRGRATLRQQHGRASCTAYVCV